MINIETSGTKFDIILAGAGGAGLLLVHELLKSALRSQSILLIDKDTKSTNDRTWCYWSNENRWTDSICTNSWNQLVFHGDPFTKEIQLLDYRYHQLRGIDLYNAVKTEISMAPNIKWIIGNIGKIAEAEDGGVVEVDGVTYFGKWIFRSSIDPSTFQFDPSQYHHLKQHFLGWTIRTQEDVFAPGIATLFDFRTPQEGNLRFFYILPSSTRQALVEFTVFSPAVLQRKEYENRLREYITRTITSSPYQVLETEAGVIPMTDYPFKRIESPHVVNIGTAGGMVKPSTGYAFLRMLEDAQHITRALTEHGRPYPVPTHPIRYCLFDSILLQILYRQGNLGKPIFTALFRNNPIGRIFRFLDESNSLLEDLRLIASLPPVPFLWSLIKLKLFRQI